MNEKREQNFHQREREIVFLLGGNVVGEKSLKLTFTHTYFDE